VPAATVDPTAIVMVEVPVPVIEVGLKETVTPLGWPLALNTTGVLNPPVVVLVIVEVPDLPCATDTDEGLAERVNPEVAPEIVTTTPAEGIPLATTKTVLAPVSMLEGTSKLVETIVLPVERPIVL
jgi:hypothetical protein